MNEVSWRTSWSRSKLIAANLEERPLKLNEHLTTLFESLLIAQTNQLKKIILPMRDQMLKLHEEVTNEKRKAVSKKYFIEINNIKIKMLDEGKFFSMIYKYKQRLLELLSNFIKVVNNSRCYPLTHINRTAGLFAWKFDDTLRIHFIRHRVEKLLWKNQNGIRRNWSQTFQIHRIIDGGRVRNLKATLFSVDFSKSFDFIDQGKMANIFSLGSFRKMKKKRKRNFHCYYDVLENPKAMVHSLDGDTDFFYIVEYRRGTRYFFFGMPGVFWQRHAPGPTLKKDLCCTCLFNGALDKYWHAGNS